MKYQRERIVLLVLLDLFVPLLLFDSLHFCLLVYEMDPLRQIEWI